MRLSLHQYLALFWIIGAPWAFAPVLVSVKRPDAGVVLAWGIAIVAVMILSVPSLLRQPAFRGWYGWTDAFSDRQRQALAQRDLRRYYQAAFDDGYVSRVTPYAWRLIWTVAVLLVPGTVIHADTGISVLDALMLFPMWYLLGVLALIIASVPMSWQINARKGRPR